MSKRSSHNAPLSLGAAGVCKWKTLAAASLGFDLTSVLKVSSRAPPVWLLRSKQDPPPGEAVVSGFQAGTCATSRTQGVAALRPSRLLDFPEPGPWEGAWRPLP